MCGVFFLSLSDDPYEKINGSERRGKGLRKRRDLGENITRGSHSAGKGLSDCGTGEVRFQQHWWWPWQNYCLI